MIGKLTDERLFCFSALQRAEIAEISTPPLRRYKLRCFSALQRAEIAEIPPDADRARDGRAFQCSSTSRNC